jgi:hypothetical protein
MPANANKKDIALGKSVTCILTDTSFAGARKTIVVRLFPPEAGSRGNLEDTNSEVMDLCRNRTKPAEHQEEAPTDVESDEPSRPRPSTAMSYYRLIIRCGSGWLSAREYLNNLYFTHIRALKPYLEAYMTSPDHTLAVRAQALGPPPSIKDTIPIQPLFHPFLRLPPELQEQILLTAAGLSKHVNLCAGRHSLASKPPISLSTMLRISKPINKTLAPYIYRSTTFHLGTTGLTSFLWCLGPTHRLQIRRLTLHFGHLTLLHCLRWLSPNSVYELLEQPPITHPPPLAHFWRAQLQDLLREVQLHILTIDLEGVEGPDIPFIARVLRGVFGGVEEVRFVQTDGWGRVQELELGEDVWRLEGLGQRTWRELCKMCFLMYREQYGYFSKEVAKMEGEEMEERMDRDWKFFDA